jgi:hypothetical protein
MAQQRERERVARKKERATRHRECRERRSEEFRLREHQGLSSPGTEEYSSSDEEEEEEEEVRGQVLPDRWEPADPSPKPAPVARVASPGAGAEVPATRQSTTEAARAAEAPVRASGAFARAVEMAGGAAPAAPATSAGTSRKRKRAFSSSRLGIIFRGVACPMGENLTVCLHFCRAVPTVPPLAPAKVLREDGSIPTRRCSSRAPRAGPSEAATASASSQGAAEVSRPQPVVSPTRPQPAVAEERQAPVVLEAEARAEAEAQPAAPVTVALPAASAVGGHPAPTAAETRLEAAAVAPQQELAVTEAWAEVVVEARPEPTLAGSSQAMAVEIPDDDVPLPGWDQWVNLPMPSPEP